MYPGAHDPNRYPLKPREGRPWREWPRSAKALAVATLAAFAVHAVVTPQVAPPQLVEATVPQLVMFAFGLALSALSAYLASQKDRSLISDDSSKTQAERGAFVPWIVGRQRTGPVILWVEGSTISPLSFGDGAPPLGGKRGGKSQGPFNSKVWHGICVGPASRIRNVYFNGSIVATGYITPENTPSGSSIHIPGAGDMRVYWGDRDGFTPDSILSAAFGFASRYPYLCSVLWEKLELGNIPQHPLIEYEVEVQPHGSQLKQSPGWIASTLDDPGAGANVPTNQSPAPGGKFFYLVNDWTATFRPQAFIRLSGQDSTRIFGKSQVYCDVTLSGYNPFNNRTQVTVGFETSRTVTNQIVQAGDFAAVLTDSDDDGVNPAHAMYHVLFAPPPWGRAKDPGKYDIDSLEAFGVRCAFTENLRGDIKAQEGESADAVVAQTLQDYSLALPWDYTRGKYVFLAIREPEGTLPFIGRPLIMAPLPEVEVLHNKAPSDQVVFTFRDRTQNYRDMTLLVANDGQRNSSRQTKTRKVAITSTTHFDTAMRIAKRREQEELANQTTFKTNVQRDARYLVPGMAYEQYGTDFVLRLFSSRLSVLTPKAEHKSLVDVYGVPSTIHDDELEGAGDSHFGTSPPAVDPAEDAAVGLFEPPRFYNDEDISVVVLRVRSSESIAGAYVWLSSDGDTYIRVVYDDSIHSAVTLTDDMSDSILVTDAVGDQVGFEIGTVGEDLTGDETSWRLGRQISICGDELMYARSLTAAGGDSYTVDANLRGRLGTPVQEHLTGATMFISKAHLIKPIKSALFQPGATVYVKVQPVTIDGRARDLDSCTEHSIVIANKAWTPLAPVNLGTKRGALTWGAGEAVSVFWRYFSTEWPQTGAGMQGAGAASATSPVQGKFEVVIGDPEEPESATLSVDVPELVLDTALLVEVFGSEPASFPISVRHVFAGRRSDALTATLTKV